MKFMKLFFLGGGVASYKSLGTSQEGYTGERLVGHTRITGEMRITYTV
jgi:hypothetical protein